MIDKIRKSFRSFIEPLFQICEVCGEHKLYGCECGWVTTAIVVAGLAVAAASAGYGAYSASEAQATQARNAKAMANRQAEADAAAGEARRKQVEYDAKRKQQTIRSREAAAGVQIGEGSLLESEMQFASDSEYAAQVAQLPYAMSSDAAAYEGRIFGSVARRASGSAGVNTGIAAGSTLANGAASAYGKYQYYKQSPSAQETYPT